MSHTTTIDGILFTDMNALQQAVNELNAQGVRCELKHNVAPRAYYSNQQGMGQADTVLHLHDAKYDVGFYPAEGKQGYEARTDFWGGSVEQQLGVKGNDAQSKLGKLYQGYAVCAIERQAIMEGRTTQRVQKQDGTVQLVVTG